MINEHLISDLQTAEWGNKKHLLKLFLYWADSKWTKCKVPDTETAKKSILNGESSDMHLDMRDQVYFVDDGRKGLKDVCGHTLIPAEFDDIPERYSYFDRGELIPVCKEGKTFLYSLKENKIISRAYDRIIRYFGTYINYFVAFIGNKKGLLNGDNGKEITPIELDKIYDALDPDSIIPVEKNMKWGAVWGNTYARPIFNDMEIQSECYVKVWLSGKQGWIDANGQFTLDSSKAAFGSWYDADK